MTTSCNQNTAQQEQLRYLFSPKSIAIIGASRSRGSIGAELLLNIKSYGYKGRLFAVNSSGVAVHGIATFKSIVHIPDTVDLAMIVVPATAVLEIAHECAEKKVQALVVVSAGFSEGGAEGVKREQELVRLCRASGMRLVGPNCMGLANTSPDVQLHATFVPTEPTRGRIAFMTQSGALGLTIMEYARTLGDGLSSFISCGNRADVSANDLLEYWEQDPNTDVIMLYLETFGNSRKFSKLARRIGHKKPIVAVKSGRTHAGLRGASSHTGALLAASEVTVNALFRYSGVIRTDTLEESFDVATFLAHQPIPKGRRTAIITNAGGPGVLCADCCEANGLIVPMLSAQTQAQLKSILPQEASVRNPVDLLAAGTPAQYSRAIEIVAADPDVDIVIVIYIPPLATHGKEAAAAIARATASLNRAKPVATVFLSTRGVSPELHDSGVHIPAYPFPESAAIAVAHAAKYGEWRRLATPIEIDTNNFDTATAQHIVNTAIERGDSWLSPTSVNQLLQIFDLPIVEHAFANDASGAASLWSKFNSPVVLKAIGPNLLHKSDIGAVALNLKSEEEVRDAAQEMIARVKNAGHEIEGFLLQPMVNSGVEMIVGMVQDAQFGPLIACGAGGVMVELMRDVQVRLTPVTRSDAREMLQQLHSFPLLTGYRGRQVCKIDTLQDIIVRISALVECLPQIVELDLNPVIVDQHGSTIVDARIRLSSQ